MHANRGRLRLRLRSHACDLQISRTTPIRGSRPRVRYPERVRQVELEVTPPRDTMVTRTVCSFYRKQRVARRSIHARGTYALGLGLAALFGLACSDGPVVVLGDRAPPRYRFAPPEVVSELSVPAKTDNPTLTADMLEIFFTSERDRVPADIFVAERSDRADRFGPPRRVDAVSAAGVETSPAVSADGLTLWFASDRAGGEGALDIWVATRKMRAAAWSAPANLPALNSNTNDIPRPPGQHARVMPMASERDTPGYYQILFTARRALRAVRETRAGSGARVSESEHRRRLSQRRRVDVVLCDGAAVRRGRPVHGITALDLRRVRVRHAARRLEHQERRA